jgi:hypothetical protein
MNLLRRRKSPRLAAHKVGVARSAFLRDLFGALLLIACASTNAAVISAASGSRNDVQAAINFAGPGDTVVIPPGSNNWTAGVSAYLNNVTIMGAGTTNVGGGDQTIIVDNISSNAPLFSLSGPTNAAYRVSGITFMSGNGAIKDNATLAFNGLMRLDHLHLSFPSYNNYKVAGIGGFGVLDHCILDLWGVNALYISNGRSGAGEVQGNLEWSLPTQFGGTNYFFIEDNIVKGHLYDGTTVYSTRLLDSWTAAKVVVRFNTMVSCCLYEVHATGHSGDDRGTRAVEAYGNYVTSPLLADPNFVMADVSSGCQLIWGNSADQVYKGMFQFNVTRKNNATYGQQRTSAGWGYAGTNFNGTGSAWDGNTDIGTGYPAIDQPGRGQGDLLNRYFPAKVNNTTGTIHWPNQALEPVYIWANVGTQVNGWGRGYYNDESYGRVQPNRDYYPQASGIQTSPTSPFNGTTGCGWGTLANRPTTCTPGVAYFATDQGAWNQSANNPYGVRQNGASGVLYVATAANTWTLYYTPCTYPHPLQASEGSSILNMNSNTISNTVLPPTSLRASAP